MIAFEENRAPSICHSDSEASWYSIVAGTSDRCTGNSGGEKYVAIRCSSEATGDDGPQMCSSVSLRQIGSNMPSPSRWSTCRWVSRRNMRWAPSRTSRTPSSRMPVPASRITTSQSGGRSSMHEVLPP